MVSRRPRIAARLRRGRGEGYNLVVLMVMVTVANILVAAALPVWSQAMQRQKEEELIFRGLQYAEAIRVFQVRNGRYPLKLRELMEIEPRAIRQLWTDPFRDDGKWGLILAQSQQGGQQVGGPGAQGQAPERGRRAAGRREEEEGRPPVPVEDVSSDDFDGGRLDGEVQATGPIIGVRSLDGEEAIRSFLGSSQRDTWEFRADLIPILPAAPGIDSVPRLTSDYIGRPFPEGLEPGQGNAPGLGGSSDKDDRRRGQGDRTNPSDRRNRRDSPSRPPRPTGGESG